MLGKYLQMLTESLENKFSLLEQIEEKSKAQSVMIENDASFEEIDANMDEKQELIDRIIRMDEGFQALFDKIKAELDSNRDQYKDEITKIQGLITRVMEKSTSIEAIESRNKAGMEHKFAEARKTARHQLDAASAAQNYYSVSNKLNAITPQFMDKKK